MQIPVDIAMGPEDKNAVIIVTFLILIPSIDEELNQESSSDYGDEDSIMTIIFSGPWVT